jgi:hypothetical protein
LLLLAVQPADANGVAPETSEAQWLKIQYAKPFRKLYENVNVFSLSLQKGQFTVFHMLKIAQSQASVARGTLSRNAAVIGCTVL